MIRREPGVAYIDTHLWVPKTVQPEILDRLKEKYTFLDPEYMPGLPSTYRLWMEAPYHLVVPRTCIVPGLGLVDLRPPTEPVDLVSAIALRDYQEDAVREWMDSPGGILNLACGKGKTVCALEAIARMGAPALVVVHTGLLRKQWKQRIEEFLPTASIGEIQGPVGTWTPYKDVVVAMLDTLYYHRYAITPEIRCRFGMVVFDEVHRLPSKEYKALADIFPGARYGLTATTERADGRHIITRHHLGPVFYSDLWQVTPRVYFQVVEFMVNPKDPDVSPYIRDTKGNINLGRLRTFVGRMPNRNAWIANYIKWLRSLGRRLIVLTHCRDQVYIIRDLLAQLGVVAGTCSGLEGVEGRLETVAENDVIIGTSQIAGEGLDKMSLDTLLLLSPVGRDVSGENSIQQSIGRILRPVVGKDPVVIVLHDALIRRFHRMALAMANIMKSWPEAKGGSLPVEYVQFQELPPIGGQL